MRSTGLFVLLTLLGCSGLFSSSDDADETVIPRPVSFVEDEDLNGLRLVLSEGDTPRTDVDRPDVADATDLSEAELDALLARLPELEDEHGDRQTFAVRTGSMPPPRTGATVGLPWPPPDKPDVPDTEVDEALSILRFAPEGDVPMAPHLSITFSQPMIALTSADAASAKVPIGLVPEPPGQWRWVGTRTLLFEPDPRFPMATTYTVTVPAGTESAVGGKLEETLTWTFATPTPALKHSTPTSGPQDLEPMVVLGFDQAVSKPAVLEHFELTAAGEPIAVRLASSSEIDTWKTERGGVWGSDDLDEERWVWLRATEPLAKGTHYDAAVRQGLPSEEGPRTTEADQSFGFETFHPLKTVEHRCGWGQDPCPPQSGWWIRFNNPLDAETFDPATVQVEPAADLRIYVNGDYLNLDGAKQGRTTYTVTVPSSVPDVFDQTLGKPETFEFEVGPADRTLYAGGGEVVVLDPGAPPSLAIYSTNHPQLKLRVYRVGPEHYGPFSKWMRDHRYDLLHRPRLPGKRVVDTVIDITGEDDRLTETALDLSKYLDADQHGQLLVHIEPLTRRDQWDRQEILQWVQATDIGLTAFADPTRLWGWASSLHDGAPLADVELQIHPTEVRGTTGADGVAEVALGDDSTGPHVLVARSGGDLALLPQAGGWWNDRGGWVDQNPRDSIRWFVFDDRGMYKPGEEVTVKGWVRRFEAGPTGGIRSVTDALHGMMWVLNGPRGNEIATGELQVSTAGGFDLKVSLPDDINLGTANLYLSSSTDDGTTGTSTTHRIQVQEFRRPEFEVKATVATPAPHILGEHATVTATAAYYAGGGLASAPVGWWATASPTAYIPPNREAYQFGAWTPWWRSWHDPGGQGSPGANLEGKTDATGAHHLDVHFQAMNPPRPMSVSLQATITDVNRQAWTATTTALVHPSRLYVGLKPTRNFVELGEALEVEHLVVDIDGEVVGDVATEVEFERLVWGSKRGQWQEWAEDSHTCSKASRQKAVLCEFTPDKGGSWRVTARITDELGRANETQIRLWVTGGDAVPSRNVAMEEVLLVPNAKEYQPGETAEIFVQAPFAPSEGILSYRRSGMLHRQSIHLDEATTTLAVPITDAHTPNLHLQLDLVGQQQRTDDQGKPRPDLPRRPAFASAKLNLSVPPAGRTLSVEVTPEVEAIEPGGRTTVSIAVHDANGKAVPDAEVAVVAVDESVLALSGYQMADPVALFYAHRGAGVRDHHLRSHLVLTNPESDALEGPAPAQAPRAGNVGGVVGATTRSPRRASPKKKNKDGNGFADRASAEQPEAVERERSDLDVTDEEAPSEPDTAIAVRTDFDALALFAPAVKTDRSGAATVDLELPDSLTRYRIMAVAVAGDDTFGKGESSITARNPVMLRPSPPRFLNFGDRAELPIVVQNQTGRPLAVQVAIRATNAIFDGGDQRAGSRITVPAEDRVELRFPVATDMAGTARFQVAVAAGDFADAATFDLPVWTPATSEAFATYGVIDDGAMVQPVEAPPDVWTQFGGLEITTSSTALQALTDAVLYLNAYPHECHEQLSSRLLANAALRDVLAAFEAEGLPTSEALTASIEADLAKLAKRQNPDGGWAFWRRGDESWPYLTVHVGHAMSRAEDKGYELPANSRARMLRYLQNIEGHIPHWYDIRHRRTIEAYALYVRRRLDDTDAAKARNLYAQSGNEGITMEGLGWLLPTLHASRRTADVNAILRYLENHVTETAAGAHFTQGYTDGAQHVLLHSDRRVDGVLLEALIEVDPESDLIVKVVNGLLAHRTKGRWANTQENGFVLVALDRYFAVFEKQTPDFVARAWLGDGFAGEHEFRGRTTERARIDIPMGYLTEHDQARDLVLAKDGPGRMYYRIGLRYAPKSLRLDAADRGFAIERVYEAVDDPDDVRRDDDGTWHIAAGSRVRVRLTMATPMRRYHVALVDPLPAGLEALNPALAVTGALPADPNSESSGRYWWWSRTWYEHENLRDERVEAFTSLLWDGVHEYTYLARATTPGQFVVPPTKAEEMYHPETFGRSATERVVVE